MRPVGDNVRTFDLGRYRLSVAGDTCVGHRHPANFDVVHVDPDLPFVAVADGMGDGPGSAAAGTTAMATMVAAVRALGRDRSPDGLRAAVAEAQVRVGAAGVRLGELTGCTLTALLPNPEAADAWIVQIGDSRVYRLRGGLLELLTVDHTAAWLGTIHGWYPVGSTSAASARYRLTRYVGHPDRPEADLLNVSLRPGDVYCLCTDGVTEQLDYGRLRDLLGGAEPGTAVRRILAATLAAGGEDDATAAVLRVDGRVDLPVAGPVQGLAERRPPPRPR